MKTNTLKKLKRFTRALTGMTLAVAMALTAGAFSAKADDLPRDREFPNLSGKGTINVTMKDGDGKAVAGGTLEAYKVAEVYVDNGFKLRFEDPFKSLAEDYPLAEDSNLTSELASAADSLITDTVKSAAVQDIDKNGTASLAVPKIGLYVIRQTKAAEGYKRIDPFIVTIPYYDKAVLTEDGGMIKAQYDVDATPKVEAVKPNVLEPCKADPPARKIVESTSAKTGEEFTFEFESYQPKSAPMPEGSIDGKKTIRVKTSEYESGYPVSKAEDGEAGTITFEEPGTYIYTFHEVDDGKYDYEYDDKYYYITYDVEYGIGANEGKLVIGSVDARIGSLNGTAYKNAPYNDLNTSFASPETVVFEFTNKPKEEETTTRRRSSGGSSTNTRPGFPVESSTPDAGVLGAERDIPGGLDQGVLGAARLPQTGQLWWPVPILLIGGALLIGGGYRGRRKED